MLYVFCPNRYPVWPDDSVLQMQQELFDVYLELLDSELATQFIAELLTEVMVHITAF